MCILMLLFKQTYTHAPSPEYDAGFAADLAFLMEFPILFPRILLLCGFAHDWTLISGLILHSLEFLTFMISLRLICVFTHFFATALVSIVLSSCIMQYSM